ncbi:MAG: alr0857 family protein [Coleofasciculaceae cyanobacterium]
MLKLTYTENGFYLEHLTQPLEDWVTARVMLALRAGTNLCVEPSTASFLLPADLPQLRHLERHKEGEEAIALSLCDAEFIEVSLQGTWMTSNTDGAEGVFVTSMNYAAEFFLLKLWEESQTRTRCLP